MVQHALGYEFEDANLLEEALESEGSGVGSVGQGEKMRTFARGNVGLARVGGMVVRFVQEDVAYRARISEGKILHLLISPVLTSSMDKGKESLIPTRRRCDI